MVLKINNVKDEFLDNILEEAMKEFNKFFKLKWERNKPLIVQVVAENLVIIVVR